MIIYVLKSIKGGSDKGKWRTYGEIKDGVGGGNPTSYRLYFDISKLTFPFGKGRGKACGTFPLG